MPNFLQKLKKLMKVGLVVSSDDTSTYPVIFVNYLGKLKARAINFTPFGLWSNPPVSAMSMLFNMNGNESNKFALTGELKDRPFKNTSPGDVILGNLASQFYFNVDGSIAVFINGVETLSFDTSGNITLLGNFTMTGNLDVTGDVAVAGAITATGIVQGSDLTNGLVPYTTHVHSETGSVTGAPQ